MTLLDRLPARPTLRRALGALAVAALLPALATGPATSAEPAAAGKRFPTHLDLPEGFAPEGIAIGRGAFAYLGSRETGDILRLNLRSGNTVTISDLPEDTPSLGMKVDRYERLWVAGGSGGDGRVVDSVTGEVLASYDFASDPTFVNDVVLAGGSAWFTDSNQAQLYRVPVTRRLFGQGAVETLPLSGEWEQVDGELNANGISTTPDGSALLVVNSTTGDLYRVDPRTGEATVVDIGRVNLAAGDGMLREGDLLYVVRNRLDKIVVLRMAPSGTTANKVKAIRSDDFDVPTTMARFRRRLYLPDARFTTPDAEQFSVTGVVS